MMKQDWKASLRHTALDLAAVLSFGLTLWLAFNDKASSGTVTGLMAVGFAALRYLPLIDSIEAFGLKAKLRETVNEADDLLSGLRTATSTASKLAYFQLAYIGRMASPKWDRKRELLAQVDHALKEIGETSENVAALREPILRFLLADIYFLFSRLVSERVDAVRKGINAEHNEKFAGRAIDPTDPEHLRLTKALQSLNDLVLWTTI